MRGKPTEERWTNLRDIQIQKAVELSKKPIKELKGTRSILTIPYVQKRLEEEFPKAEDSKVLKEVVKRLKKQK